VSDKGPSFGINFYGHVSGNFGLAVAARSTLRALREKGVEVCVVDIDAGTGRSGHDTTYAALACGDPAGRLPVSLFHTNPTDVLSYSVEIPSRTWEPDRLRVLVPFWELPKIPEGLWTEFISAMDLVMAPTLFVAENIRKSCPDAQVIHYPQAVFLPDGVRRDRARFGLPEDAFVCVTVMDASSGFERKNPIASVEAFTRAFEGLSASDVRLVVKMNDRRGAKGFSAQIDAFRAQAEADPRIVVIEESMTYVDVLSLNASADVLLSLHRAEGLGLNLMEAMSLGTVVVGTGWSGNMDFMTPENSAIVPFEEVAVSSLHPSYAPSVIGEGQYWVDPDVAVAAQRLRALFDDRPRLAALATQASADMDSARERFLRAEWIEQVRALLDAGTLGSTAHAERTDRFRLAVQVSPLRRVRRMLGNAMRRLRLL
jgi:glycosyltransferase involved in cell wall biosynthesis